MYFRKSKYESKKPGTSNLVDENVLNVTKYAGGIQDLYTKIHIKNTNMHTIKPQIFPPDTDTPKTSFLPIYPKRHLNLALPCAYPSLSLKIQAASPTV